MRILTDLLPDHIKEVTEISEIISSIQIETDLLFTERYNILDNQFLEKADETGISHFEKIYNLTDNSACSLEERRFALKTLMLERRPTTLLFLKNQLAILCGENGFEFSFDSENFYILVLLELAKRSELDAVYKLLSAIIPAIFSFEVDLLYNTHSMYEQNTYEEIAVFTHADLREFIFD